VSAAQHDVWASGDAYEPFVGRWSRRAAREFIAWLARLQIRVGSMLAAAPVRSRRRS
jgi:hypothetical protein